MKLLKLTTGLFALTLGALFVCALVIAPAFEADPPQDSSPALADASPGWAEELCFEITAAGTADYGYTTAADYSSTATAHTGYEHTPHRLTDSLKWPGQYTAAALEHGSSGTAHTAAAGLAAALGSLLFILGLRRTCTAANAESPGTHEEGAIRYLAEAAIDYHLVVKAGTAANQVDVCGVSDIPLGIAQDKAAQDAALTVRHLGASGRTALGVASAAILRGAFVVPAAGGKIRTLPTAAGTYHIIGRAIQAAADDGDEVEIEPSFPVQRVVTG